MSDRLGCQRQFRRRLFFALDGLLALGGTLALWSVLRAGGMAPAEWLLLALFGTLLAWIGTGFLIPAFGAYALLVRRARDRVAEQAPDDAPASIQACPPRPARTAIVMPIYNEDVERVFAGIRATCQSLRAADALQGFDIFVLSDTTDPEIWLAEERAWARTCQDSALAGRLFYRHRPRNLGRKSGNIADFCERWGARYEYMVVLDADSVMSGRTLVGMVREMAAKPRLGLLQVWSRPALGHTPFARIQQFAAFLHGPLNAAGIGYLQGAAGNYWGHNAIIRVRPFMAHCGLPSLPGAPPLGGEILSHDFVEAALLVQAGWEVRMATALDASYEEGPPSLLDHAKRDRRWCQGNLQHARLLFARGLHPMSRLHLLMGIMAYLSSPLWLLFLLLSLIEAWRGGTLLQAASRGSGGDPVLLGLLGLTAGLLLLPKLAGLAVGLAGHAARSPAGAARLTASLLLETLFSMLLAPIMMVRHSSFVLQLLAGRSVSWTPQQRDPNRLRWAEAARGHGLEVLTAVLLTALAWGSGQTLVWWLSPVIAGLLLAVPLSVWSSRADRGRWAARLGLFMIPEEVGTVPVLQAVAENRAALSSRETAGKRDSLAELLSDPRAARLHFGLLTPGLPAGSDAEALTLGIVAEILRHGLGALGPSERMALLSDAALFRQVRAALSDANEPPGEPSTAASGTVGEAA